MRATRVDSHSRGLRSNVGAGPHSGSGWQLIRQHVRRRIVMSGMVAEVQQPAVWRSVVPATVHTLAVLALPRGQPGGPLSPESPRPLRATEVPGPVVLQPRRLPTPSRSGDLWTFLGAPPRSSTLYDLGELWVFRLDAGATDTSGCAELCGHPHQGASTQASKSC